MSGWIDISVPLRNGMVVWKGDPPARFEQVAFMERGDMCNVTRANISVHTGTHMDAPRHFVQGGAGMEALPLDAVLGPARVIPISDPVSIKPSELPADLKPGDRILFRTVNSTRCWAIEEFVEDFVYISQEAARELVDAGVRTVGIDYLSIGGFTNDLVETHEILLGAGVWVIEGLNLAHIEPGDYELACLPLLIPGSDGAPARAALRPLR